jgi:hypothetical protein
MCLWALRTYSVGGVHLCFGIPGGGADLTVQLKGAPAGVGRGFPQSENLGTRTKYVPMPWHSLIWVVTVSGVLLGGGRYSLGARRVPRKQMAHLVGCALPFSLHSQGFATRDPLPPQSAWEWIPLPPQPFIPVRNTNSTLHSFSLPPAPPSIYTLSVINSHTLLPPCWVTIPPALALQPHSQPGNPA